MEILRLLRIIPSIIDLIQMIDFQYLRALDFKVQGIKHKLQDGTQIYIVHTV